MMFLKACDAAFDAAALADLRACAAALIEQCGKDRTSLGHHLANPDLRPFIVSAAQRFHASSLPTLFAERFGTLPCLNLSYTTIRLQLPGRPTTQVGWHLDLNFVLDGAPFLVAWVPLEEVGEIRPGLDICLPRRPVNVQTLLAPWKARASEGRDLVFPDAEVAAMFGAPGYQTRTPRLSAGDALVFDQFVLHRTQRMPQATQPRHSFEFRMVDLGNLPALARRSSGLFCRSDPSSADGVEFLVKDDRPLRPISGRNLDQITTMP